MARMNFETFIERSAELARRTLGQNLGTLLRGTLPDKTYVAVYSGVPSDRHISHYQLFTLGPRQGKVREREQVSFGSQTEIHHPSVDYYYGQDEQGRGTRGPWSITFQSLGKIVIPPAISGENPKLVTTTSTVDQRGVPHLEIRRAEIELAPQEFPEPAIQ